MALSAVGAAVLLYRWGVMALLAGVLPVGDAGLTALRRIGVTAALFASYWAVARWYERRIITEFAPRPLQISAGALAGVATIGITIGTLFATGHYQAVEYRGFSVALPIMSAIVLGVVLEEVVFRGILFRLTERHAGTVRALAVQAVLFGALHLFNDGTSWMTVVSVTLLGALWAAIFVYTRNLWVVVAHHAAWNLTIFVSGVPLSGQEAWRRLAPLQSSVEGPAWWTGGGFGPEDSVLNVLLVTSVLAGLLYRAWRRGAFGEPRLTCP